MEPVRAPTSILVVSPSSGSVKRRWKVPYARGGLAVLSPGGPPHFSHGAGSVPFPFRHVLGLIETSGLTCGRENVFLLDARFSVELLGEALLLSPPSTSLARHRRLVVVANG